MNHDQTNDAAREARSTIGSVAADIRSAASDKIGEAVTEARTRADDAKAGVANDVSDVAMALRRVSEDMRGGSVQERTLGAIAGSLADASDSIRDKDLGEMLDMVRTAARENPVLFIGGAALLGFAVSRYAKASGDQTRARAAHEKVEIDAFVDDGNPHTQPARAAQ
jgi:hypothetical protein